MKKSIKEIKSIHILSLLGLVFLISACGGSGGGSSATPVPTKPSDLKCPATIGDDFADYKAIDNYYDLKFYLVNEGSGFNNRGAKYCLTSDITIGSDFATIGSFSGTINGQGKAINNLKLTFIRENYGNLNRITFNQPVISSALGDYLGFERFTAIITQNTDRGIIEKIKVNKPEISGENASGLIGYNSGAVNNILVTGGKVNSTANLYSGGIVSRNFKNIGPNLKVTGMTLTSTVSFGGLVGYNNFNGAITYGQVTSTTITGSNVGGIAGEANSGAINNSCVSDLTLSGSEKTGYILGLTKGNISYSENQFNPKNKKTNGDPDHWGVGDATAANAAISLINTACPELAFDFN